MKYCANPANGKWKTFNHNKVTGESQLNNETGREREGYNYYYLTSPKPIRQTWHEKKKQQSQHVSLWGKDEERHSIKNLCGIGTETHPV